MNNSYQPGLAHLAKGDVKFVKYAISFKEGGEWKRSINQSINQSFLA